MIPKVIHYIWLGGKEEPKLLQKCKESWKKYCPDYEIKRWDESNLDMDRYQYVKDALSAKKFAFAADVFRFEILKNVGGIYVDVDVEFLKPIDKLLDTEAFLGFETDRCVNPGLIMGACAGHEYISDILEGYKTRNFADDMKNNETVCTITTRYLETKGLVANNTNQTLEKMDVYATEYFCPISIITNKKKITKNTLTIHWYNASWFSPKQKCKQFVKKMLNFCTFGAFGKWLEKRRQK